MDEKAKPIIEIRNLVKRYKGLVALDHLNLSVREGEIYGLLGPNGSGKTTAIHCMLALLRYDKGDIRLWGKPMNADAYAIKRQIGVVMQNVAVVDELTVRENIDYFCSFYVEDKKARAELVDRAIEFTGLDDFQKFFPRKLSGGLLRRLNIACGIAHKPRLIFLDEPTVAVDPQSRNRILEGLKEINQEGATLVYTTHYMEEAEMLCDRIGILDKGKLIAEGSTAELKAMISSGDSITLELLRYEEKALEMLNNCDFVRSWEREGDLLRIQAEQGEHRLSQVLDFLKRNQIEYDSVFAEKPTLNTVFLEITGKELRDHA